MPKVLRARFFLGGLVSLALVFFFAAFIHPVGGRMSAISPQFVQMSGKTKTVCVGRFLIDVPTTAQVVYGPTDAALNTERLPRKGPDLDLIVASRLLEIERDRAYASGALSGNSSLVGTVRDGAIPNQKILFGVSTSSGAFYRVESYLKVGEDIFIQEGEAYSKNNELEELVHTMNVVAPMLQSRTADVIPVGPGLCIDGGFIRGAAKLEYENLTLGVRLAEYPDVHFSMSTSLKPFIVESDALDTRLAEAEKMAYQSGNGAWYLRIKMLRRGRRQIGRWDGFEVLARKPPQVKEGESHEFAFVSHGEPNNPMLPVLKISMYTGVKGNRTGGIQPSITDEEAISLWDKLSNSIRARD
ncbi:T6SS immunity protein Tli4 family protein [Duganella sp. PWIR1]